MGRLTPAYAITIIIMAGPLFYVNSGPVWTNMKQEMDSCRSFWWTNLLYINNLWGFNFEVGEILFNGPVLHVAGRSDSFTEVTEA